MALNPDLISFFVHNIKSATFQTFASEIAHLFEHLEFEVKDNFIYDKYMNDRRNWENWPERSGWSLPEKFEDAKSLVFSLYSTIGGKGLNGYVIPSQLFGMRSNPSETIQKFNEQFLEYFNLVIQEIINANPEIEQSKFEKIQGNTVFIIHGHDNALKTEVQLLLTRAGVNNLVLHEQADKGRTIIDKLVEESENSNFAVALLSPDDKLEDGSDRPRQNVILEIGYFMGRLGKERVRLIKKGVTDIPSDLHGILYENHDELGAWKMKLCKELMAAGIYVDIQAVASTL